MLRTHTCGELRLSDVEKEVVVCGWMQRSRDLGGMTFIDLRDRYGVTQLAFNMESQPELCQKARETGREFVLQAKGKVIERSSKNNKIPTGDIEIEVLELIVLNPAKLPPFTIEDDTDGGDDLRMKYRYLDIRRKTVRSNLELRHKMAKETRLFLDSIGFLEIETPYLIKSTPEGARDFLVPSRMNKAQFYALPQSPQTFKQLLMIGGIDRYFQIVRCFRDEDLRADRQPEFTQIDCEMSFVEQEDILQTFEGLARHLFVKVLGCDPGPFPRISWEEAMEKYGSDKPDIRFDMEFVDITGIGRGKGFVVFDSAESVIGINVEKAAAFTRKQIDALTEFVKKPQIGAQGMVYLRYNEDGTLKSSVDKFYSESELQKWAEAFNAKPGDLMLVLAGSTEKTRKALCELRLEVAEQLGLRSKTDYKPLWVVDFPLLEWNEESKRFYAMHHPFTAPKPEHIELLNTNPSEVKANAYDLVINGVEIGGGSVRIFNKALQNKMFQVLGFTQEEAQEQFGFLLEAFQYGAPPHAGIAFGFDRWCSLFGGSESIRDFIAFPKNNSGRDVMIDSPSKIEHHQLDELGIQIKPGS